jgi:hypothetical protein
MANDSGECFNRHRKRGNLSVIASLIRYARSPATAREKEGTFIDCFLSNVIGGRDANIRGSNRIRPATLEKEDMEMKEKLVIFAALSLLLIYSGQSKAEEHNRGRYGSHPYPGSLALPAHPANIFPAIQPVSNKCYVHHRGHRRPLYRRDRRQPGRIFSWTDRSACFARPTRYYYCQPVQKFVIVRSGNAYYSCSRR